MYWQIQKTEAWYYRCSCSVFEIGRWIWWYENPFSSHSSKKNQYGWEHDHFSRCSWRQNDCWRPFRSWNQCWQLGSTTIFDNFHVGECPRYERGNWAGIIFLKFAVAKFLGGQGWKTLEHRGAVKLHVGKNLSQMRGSMQQLAALSPHGLRKWHLPKMILPITVHSGLKVPKAIGKFLLVKKNVYTRAQNIDLITMVNKIKPC